MLKLSDLQRQGNDLLTELETVLGNSFSGSEWVRLFSFAVGQVGMDIYTSVLRCGEDADACRTANTWFSAALMVAAAIEGLLCICVLLLRDEVASTVAYKRLRKGGSFEDKMLNAKFEILIQISDELGWLSNTGLDQDVLDATRQDLPLVIKTLFPSESIEATMRRIERFEEKPGIEMLRLLQHLRNLIHPSRTGRYGVDLKGIEFEEDCKFCFVISYQVMSLLFSTLFSAAKARMERLASLQTSLSSSSMAELRETAALIAATSNVRFPPGLARAIDEARSVRVRG